MDEKNKKRQMRNVLIGTVALIASVMLNGVPVKAEAATEAQKEKVKQMMIDMYYSADTSSHNVYSYSLKTSEFDEIYNELQLGEHERMIGSYEHYTKITRSSFGRYVTSIRLVTEDFEALERYKRVNENADAILAGIEPEMDDLDKVIHLHDSIVELVTYNKNIGNHKYTLGGALGDKNAVCMGYAEALNLLLKELGFETDYVKSDSVNHGWSYVKLDGEWYHIDPTWDDTRSAVRGQTSRQFLLRNEAEFMAGGNNSHGTDIEHEYGSPVSRSTKYSDWFMHDVIGKMAFEDGLWYFVDPTTKDIARASADGSGYETVVKYTDAALAVVDMEGTELTYTAGGTTVVKDISKVEDNSGEIEDVIGEVGGIVEEDIVPEEGVLGGVIGDVVVEEMVNTSKPEIGEGELGKIDLCDYSLWCEGKYNENGVISAASGYFSTIECYPVQASGLYSLVMKDTRFKLVVFEYSEDGYLVTVTELGSGDIHEMNAATSCVGLSMYMPIWKNMPFSDFVTKMKYDLHTVEFTLEGVTEVEDTVEQPNEWGVCDYNAIEKVNLSDYNLWCEGEYTTQGVIGVKEGRFSMQERYYVGASESYMLTMKDTRFKVIVYEYACDGRLLASTELASGDTHKMNASTCHIGLSMYMPVWKNMPFSDLVTKLKYSLHTVELVRE